MRRGPGRLLMTTSTAMERLVLQKVRLPATPQRPRLRRSLRVAMGLQWQRRAVSPWKKEAVMPWKKLHEYQAGGSSCSHDESDHKYL